MGEVLPFHAEEQAVIPAPTGHDHASLALFPFTVTSQDSDRQSPRSFSYQMPVDGKIRRVSVELSTSADSLPVPGDQLVFLGLLQLSLDQGEIEHRLDFERKELFKRIAWDHGDAYDRLRDALQRLTTLTITTRSEMIARDGRSYQRQDAAAHLIDSYRIGNGRDARCTLEWGQIVREAAVMGDFKRLDWDLLLSLRNPLTAQLYRLLDRVTLSGEVEWSIGWKPLAAALGMNASAYSRPARFRQVLDPHLDALRDHGIIEDCDYRRGGQFVFHIHNYLRAQLRRILTEQHHVYPEPARQLLAAFDEPSIMAQIDCLEHGSRPKPSQPGGYLVEAIRGSYDLRYPDDEPVAFSGIWSLLDERERQAYHRAGLWLCEAGDSLFATNADPTAWTGEFRAVVRFMICHNLDPDLVRRRRGLGQLAG